MRLLREFARDCWPIFPWCLGIGLTPLVPSTIAYLAGSGVMLFAWGVSLDRARR